MAAARTLIIPCLSRLAVAVPQREHILEGRERVQAPFLDPDHRHHVVEAADLQVGLLVLSLDVPPLRSRRHQQVIHTLIIYLKVRRLDHEITSLACREERRHSPRDDTSVIRQVALGSEGSGMRGSHHGVRLASASLPVGEDGCIVTSQDAVNCAGDGPVDRLLGRRTSEDLQGWIKAG